MSSRLAVVFAFACAACSRPAPTAAASDASIAPASANVSVTAEAPAPAPSAPSDASATACAPGMQSEPRPIEDGACASDADCVLTDAPAQCNACNLPRPYPALRKAFEQRNAVCALGACAQCCDAVGCPPHDTYTAAFYRAECRSGRCIAWRYHGGG